MRGTIQFDINFYNLDSASIFIEKDIFGGKLANDYGELLLLSCFILRHVTNLGQKDSESVALANALPTTYEEVLKITKRINIISPLGDKSRNFSGTLFFDSEKTKLKFQLHLKGFGLLGRYVRQYVNPSVAAMISYQVQLHKEEKLFLLRLAKTCALCRDAILNGEVSSREHVQLAAQIATMSIDEYEIFDIWNNDELINIWIRWQDHKVPSMYEEKCFGYYNTVIRNFDDVLFFFQKRRMVTEDEDEKYVYTILQHTAIFYRMLFLTGLDCIFRNDTQQDADILGSQCLDIYAEILKSAQNIVEILLATNTGPFSLSRINELIVNTWQFQLETAQTCFIDGMSYGMQIKPQ